MKQRTICPHCGVKAYYFVESNGVVLAHYTCDHCRDLWWLQPRLIQETIAAYDAEQEQNEAQP